MMAAMALAAAAPVCSAQTRGGPQQGATVSPQQCRELSHVGRLKDASACYESLTQSSQHYFRAEGFWGLRKYDQANLEFRDAVAQDDKNALYRVRWGMLLHERFNNTDAADLFNEALQRDPKNAQACLGLALVSADGFDDRAIEWATKAVAFDSKLAAAYELMASLALEDSDPTNAGVEADLALKISPGALDAMAVHAAIELLADRSPDVWITKMNAMNPVYGEGYALIGHHLVLNRRYDEGVAYYRKAIAADPLLFSARSELGVNLMRLGRDKEAREELEYCYQNGYRNAATVNSLKLLDTYKEFVTIKDGQAILKLNKKEADALAPYFEQEMRDSIATYNKKYKMTLPGPVQVEVYPDHEDFAVRTLGMPGLGALGVTFGEVIAMDSPSGRKPGEFHWASTLRHEMSHAYILTATNHRVPRWFTEGLAVHEETQASPEWGDAITSEIIVALRDKKLLPVADLDRGFIRPQYPAQVIVSYYQAGKICDYIQDHWGADKLLDFVHSYAKLTTTPQAFRDNLGMSPEDFDKQFQAWLYSSTAQLVSHFDDWRTKLKALAAAAQANQNDAVIKDAPEVIRLYPDYVYDANAYEFLAQAYVAKNDKAGAQRVLTQYEKAGGRNPGALKRLAGMEEDAGDPKAAIATLERINFIDPLYDQDYHKSLGRLLMAQNDNRGAVREYATVVAMNPLDKASAEYDLASAYMAAGERDKAKESVLSSLEAAPDYRPALKLLLQLQVPEKGR